MSTISRVRYEQAATQFFQQNPREFEKYLSPNLLQTVVNAMLISLPTVTAAKIAFDRLVANGTLQRTDGRTEQDDLRENVASAEANLKRAVAKADAEPLTRSELEYFGSLSQRELSKLYWGENGDGMTEFAVRYRRANRELGFTIPPKFSDEGEITLTEAEFKAMSDSEKQRRMRSPRFKAAVYKLIRSGAAI
jgi:hypothetical protein